MNGIVILSSEDQEMIRDAAAIDAAVFPSNAWGYESYYRSALNGYDHLTAELCGGEVRGFALLRCFDDAELIRIAVSPEHRRRGIGRRLLSELIEETGRRGIHDIFLEVRSGNAAAIGLYRSAGFENAGIRKDYYHEPKEDALILRYTCEMFVYSAQAA